MYSPGMIDVEKFKSARKAAKVSQVKLAELVGVTQQAIGEIEAGRAKTSKSIYKIAKALNVKAYELDDSIPAPDPLWEEVVSEVRELDPADQEYALKNLREFIELAKRRRS